MRLASFRHDGRTGFGIVDAAGVIDISDRFPGLTLKDLLPDPERIHQTAQGRQAIPPEQIDWLPPVPVPPRIFCVGRNFRKGIARAGLETTDYPILFARFPSSQVGHLAPIVRPAVSAQFDYEGEVCVVVGKAGRHLDAASALDHVAGYTCYNDGSVRDYQRHTSQDTPGKNFWHSGAAGPWIVTRDEIPDPSALFIETQVNGETVQAERMDDLVFGVPEVLAYLSRIAPLEPGDHIALGTPFGAGINLTPPRWLQPGDEVSVTVDRIGTLTNMVIDESEAGAAG